MSVAATPASRLSPMAAGLLQSEILKIAAEIRQLVASGREVCNLTVGDFRPSEFPVPPLLVNEIVEALRDGQTNYPPSNGLPELREAIGVFYSRRMGLSVPAAHILVAGGARPIIYAAYRVLCAPGDRVVYPVPSWNNTHYCHVSGAEGVPVPCTAEEEFLPTRERLEPALRGARMLVLNSPCNPTGTMFTREALAAICEAVLEENARRGPGERPLFLLWDQVYWMLAFGDAAHVTPFSLCPDLAEVTVVVDGISKAMAATGLRVGWSVAPPDVTAAMSDLLGHVGAWAPRPEQVATARMLLDDEALDAHLTTMTAGLGQRLTLLHDGLEALGARGFPVRVLRPEGAMYLSARFDLPLGSDEAIRHWLLESAGLAAVPFQAFGARDDSGWFRLSVGAVSMTELERLIPRLEDALGARGAD